MGNYYKGRNGRNGKEKICVMLTIKVTWNKGEEDNVDCGVKCKHSWKAFNVKLNADFNTDYLLCSP